MSVVKDQAGNPISVGCRVAEADCDYSDGVVESINDRRRLQRWRQVGQRAGRRGRPQEAAAVATICSSLRNRRQLSALRCFPLHGCLLLALLVTVMEWARAILASTWSWS